jgi:hypothetical protein
LFADDRARRCAVQAWKDVIFCVGMYLSTILIGIDVSIFLAFGVCLLLLIRNTAVTHCGTARLPLRALRDSARM